MSSAPPAQAVATDKPSHLSVIVDLSPSQWHLSSQPPPANTFPLTLNSFLSQLLAFLNAHIACRHENTLAVFGAFPGKRCVSSVYSFFATRFAVVLLLWDG